MSGHKRFYLVEDHVPPNYQPILHRLEQALARGLAGLETLLVGDLNSRLDQPWDQRKESLETTSLICMI